MGVIDWQEAGKNEYPVYPEATYLVEIDEWSYQEAKSGANMVDWALRFVDGEFKNKIIHHRNVLKDQSYWSLALFVKACGLNLEKLGRMETESRAFNSVLDKCVGRKLYIHVTKQTLNNGKEANSIDDCRIYEQQAALDDLQPDSDVPAFIKEQEAAINDDTI